jgi:RNA polymerase sigma-70 factor (ECF subfamily)
MQGEADKVVAEFGPALARVAAAYERDRALREELVQDMLLAVVTALPKLKDPDRLRAFVFRVAHNRAVSHVARRVREPRSEEAGERLPSDAISQERALIERQQSEALVEAVRALPLPYREVITLLLEDLSYEEIAEALGLSLSNVGVRVNRAKQKLREQLDDDR